MNYSELNREIRSKELYRRFLNNSVHQIMSDEHAIKAFNTNPLNNLELINNGQFTIHNQEWNDSYLFTSISLVNGLKISDPQLLVLVDHKESKAMVFSFKNQYLGFDLSLSNGDDLIYVEFDGFMNFMDNWMDQWHSSGYLKQFEYLSGETSDA